MKGFARLTLNVISAMSLLLTFATMVLWVRSYWVTDFINWYSVKSGGEWRVSSTRGQFKISEHYWRGDDPPGTGENGELPKAYYGTEKSEPLSAYVPQSFVWLHWHWETGEDTVRTISLAGMTWESTTGSEQAPYSYTPLLVAIPHWLLLALALFAPGRVIHRAVRRRRSVSLGLCLSCNYDLRASTDRCPECGRATRLPK